MRTLDQYLTEYGKSHQNPVNVRIHTLCVPVIFFASVGLLWAVPLGRWLGLPAPLADWVNGGTVAALPALFFYLRLSRRSLAVMTLWFALSVAGLLALENAGLPLAWTCAALWVAAWIGQFYGHKVEGAKPSFADDLVFLLIGPLFVSEKLRRGQGRIIIHH